MFRQVQSVQFSAASLGLDLEGEDVHLTGNEEAKVKSKDAIIWQKTVDKLAVAKVKQDKAQAAENKKKVAVVEKLAEKKPVEWLKDAIDQRSVCHTQKKREWQGQEWFQRLCSGFGRRCSRYSHLRYHA